MPPQHPCSSSPSVQARRKSSKGKSPPLLLASASSRYGQSLPTSFSPQDILTGDIGNGDGARGARKSVSGSLLLSLCYSHYDFFFFFALGSCWYFAFILIIDASCPVSKSTHTPSLCQMCSRNIQEPLLECELLTCFIPLHIPST